jgi:hypothetical protein
VTKVKSPPAVKYNWQVKSPVHLSTGHAIQTFEGEVAHFQSETSKMSSAVPPYEGKDEKNLVSW